MFAITIINIAAVVIIDNWKSLTEETCHEPGFEGGDGEPTREGSGTWSASCGTSMCLSLEKANSSGLYFLIYF